jgi:uroporphyrinogen-III synthase
LKVLVTRLEPGATATAGALARLGFEPVVLPCLTAEPLAAYLPEAPAAIVLTSGQAVAALPARYHEIPCFCVGDATAAKMRRAGFRTVSSAAGDAGDLFRLLMERRVSGTYLLATGERHGLELARQLRESGIKVARRKVYRTQPVKTLPAAIRNALEASEIKKALFYSVETVRAFIRLQPPATANLEALVLSPAIAQACQGLPWQKIRVALAPNEAELLALLK